MTNMSEMQKAVARYTKAQERVRAVEAANRSEQTVNKAYRELFAAEDAMRALGI